jgi:hypothetical protein
MVSNDTRPRGPKGMNWLKRLFGIEPSSGAIEQQAMSYGAFRDTLAATGSGRYQVEIAAILATCQNLHRDMQAAGRDDVASWILGGAQVRFCCGKCNARFSDRFMATIWNSGERQSGTMVMWSSPSSDADAASQGKCPSCGNSSAVLVANQSDSSSASHETGSSSSNDEVPTLTRELIRIHKTDGFVPRRMMNPNSGMMPKKDHDPETSKLFTHYCNIRAREIGERLNELGGFSLMVEVLDRVAEALDAYAGRKLSNAWSGVGKWLD